jgi:DNA mismatch endonuclease (patch repair protein)
LWADIWRDWPPYKTKPGFSAKASVQKFLKKFLRKGTFEDVPAARARTMGAIRARNNKTTEKALRMALVRAGARGWVLHAALPGRPDFFFPKQKIAIFVDGCFWHGCKQCGHIPKTRSEFWRAKIKRNKQRDLDVTAQLKQMGLAVIRIWEHELRDIAESMPRLLSRSLQDCPQIFRKGSKQKEM